MSVREDARSGEPSDLDRSPEKSDEELRLSRWMHLAQKGDSESYRKLLTELNTMLQTYAVRAVKRSGHQGDSAFVLDIAQEILLAVHAKRHTYDSNQRFLPWVDCIARHKLMDWQRKQLTEKNAFDFEIKVGGAI